MTALPEARGEIARDGGDPRHLHPSTPIIHRDIKPTNVVSV
jgi:serine/threonine protein kinase